MKIDDFIKELGKLNISIDDTIINKLNIYYNFLIDYNKHTNLTSIVNEEDVYLKHFYDSLTLSKAYDFNSNIELLDIGTGAGFPGVVLKIFFPNIKLFLLDSNAKKTEFLKQLVNKLDLNDVTIINDRAENYIIDNRNRFDIVVSRAVAKTRILAELALPFLKVGGKLLLMKANNDVVKDEINEARKGLSILNSTLLNVISFNLPFEDSQRNILVIRKDGLINTIYPRPYDKLVKKPLK